MEMVVPYGDPNEPHYRKNAFDAGEDGLGKNAHSLKKVLHQFFFWCSYHSDLSLCLTIGFYRGVTVWDLSSTSMPISQISLEELKQLRTVFACMKKIMGFCGNIRTGEQD